MKFAIMQFFISITIFALTQFAVSGCASTSYPISKGYQSIIPGADRMETYLPYLRNKKIGVFANQTSIVGHRHLIDTLLSAGIQVAKIFSPEHGFRGIADAGEKVNNDIDAKTGLPIISLYGNHKKPTNVDLENIDVVIFDIQDVGTRFYTYISSLQYLMEAVLENNKKLIILDRPNPNGWYVDGPVLDKKFKSFVGMQPVPIVYGMTIGEYALMIAGQGWLESGKANLIYAKEQNMNRLNELIKVIPCINYDHKSKYILPISPSPNLREMQSVYLYPSICLFEGTILSEGRGTEKPFQIFGHPSLPNTLYAFTPKPNAGAKTGKYFNQTCFGWNLSGSEAEVLKKVDGKIQLHYLIDAYHLFPEKDSFFIADNFCQKVGNDKLITQIKEGIPESDIRKSWEPEIEAFKQIRKKYLLYKDYY